MGFWFLMLGTVRALTWRFQCFKMFKCPSQVNRA